MRKYSRISTKNARLIREMIQDARLLYSLYDEKRKNPTPVNFGNYWGSLSGIMAYYRKIEKLDLWYRVRDNEWRAR